MLGFAMRSCAMKHFGLRKAFAATARKARGASRGRTRPGRSPSHEANASKPQLRIEIAALLGDASEEDSRRVAVLADRVVAMLTRLILR